MEFADMIKRNPQKILVLKDDSLGDFLMAVPFFKKLKELYPKSRISALVSSSAREVAEVCPYIQEVIVANPTWYKRNPGHLENLKMCWQLAKVLSQKQFDLVIGMRRRDRMESLLLSLIKARLKVGYSVGMTGWGIQVKLPRTSLTQHEVLKNLEILKVWGKQEQKPVLEMWLNPEDEQWAKRFLDGLGRDRSKPLATLHPGAGKPVKQWGAENFANLTNSLVEKGCQVLVVLSSAEISLWEEIAPLLKHEVFACIGQATVRQMAALLKTSDVFVGNDSGPTHLAVALRVPAVCLFSGANLSDEWRPWNTDSPLKLLEGRTECRLCGRWDCPQKPENLCLRQITVADAVSAVEELLRTKKA